jgi:RNA polymerase sigma factor (TIGR02999 family)
MLSRVPEPAAGLPAGARVDDGLLARYYAEFREIARRVLRRSDARITIQPTDLAHEAALRLLGSPGVQINDENHFLALAARVIRVTLIDEIRRRSAAKRDGAVVTLWDDQDALAAPIDIAEFDQALDQLGQIEPESARIVELRFYVGLTMEEIARELAISESTALRRWRTARAWLFKELRAAD